jgi:hypothetical protein
MGLSDPKRAQINFREIAARWGHSIVTDPIDISVIELPEQTMSSDQDTNRGQRLERGIPGHFWRRRSPARRQQKRRP